MSTSPIGSSAAASSATGSTSASSALPSSLSLNPSDFINLMVTELKNQDPMQPASNEQLLAQMSQIGQLQSSTQLQSSLQTMTLQSNIAAASNMIGKTVTGLGDDSTNVTGVVNSVKILGNDVSLELDNGKALPLAKVTSVAPTTASTTPASTTPTPTAPAAN